MRRGLIPMVMRPRLLLVVAIVSLGAVGFYSLFGKVPPALAVYPESSAITFLQFELQAKDDEHGRLTPLERLRAHLSVSTVQDSPQLDSVALSPEGIEGTAASVFERLPKFIIVWPTEGYYYFRIRAGEESYAGNFRFTDIEDGVASFAMYPTEPKASPNPSGKGAATGYGYLGLNPHNGFESSRIAQSLYAVHWRGRTVYVYLDAPESHSALPQLRENEKLVSWLRDESGTRFFLVYEGKLKSFLYVLDESVPALEELSQFGTLLRGVSSGFVFYDERDLNRRVLIGVRKQDQQENSYYDGPFDQVPGRIPLREKIYEAYPYLKLSGVDEWGYFCATKGVRIAITPYQSYETDSEMLEFAETCLKRANSDGEKVNCLTFDTKQANHFRSKAFTRDGTLVTLEKPRTCELQSVKNIRG